MRVTISILLILTFFSSFGQSKDFPFNPGEEITYSAHYHWGLFWMEAGEVVFEMDTVHKNHQVIMNMQSRGKTLPKYEWLFRVRDTFSSAAYYPEMSPIYFKRSNYEGSNWVLNKYQFMPKEGLVIRDMNSNESIRRVDTIFLPAEHVLDVQTAVYYTRMWNLKDASKGDQKIIKLMLAGDYFSIPITYRGKEIVKHKNGKNYSCYKITTKVAAGLIFRENQEISIYVSDDQARLPIVVKAPIIIGRVEAYLQKTDDISFPRSIDD